MSFDLGDYVEVKDRIAEFKRLYPDGRLTSMIVPSGFDGFIAVKAFAWRSSEDSQPGTGLAWEPVPGKTPYTKDSELQNAETSAWGRAIVAALIADASGGVASADEVRNRIGGQESTTIEPVASVATISPSPAPQCPSCGAKVYDNRSENFGTKKPLWKCSNKACKGGKNGWAWASWNPEEFDGGVAVREDYEPIPYGPDEEPF